MNDILTRSEARDEYGRLLNTFLLHSGWNDRGNALRTRYDVTVRKAYFKLGLGVPGSTPLGIIEEAVLNELLSESLKRAAQETRDCFNRLQHQYSAETDWGEKSVEFTEESYGQALEATANLIFVFSREPIPEKLKLAYRRFTPAVMEGDEWASVSILADLSDGAATLADGGRLAEGLLGLPDGARASGLDKVNFHLYFRQAGEVTGLNVRSSQDMFRNSESSTPRGHELLEEILESNREEEQAGASAFTPWLIWLRRDATPMSGRTLELFKEEVSSGRLRVLRLPLNEKAREAFNDEYNAAGLRGTTPPPADIANLPLDIKLILNTLRFELRKAGIAKFEDPK